MGIPTRADEVTAAWFNDHLDWGVTDVALTEIGVGLGVTSAVYRAALTGGTGPDSVVVKLTALDEAAAFTAAVLSMYRREVAFFDQLAVSAPVRVPASHYGEVSDDGGQVVVVMEDLAGNRAGDQVVGLETADAERAIDGIAAWHAQWWNRCEGLCASGAAVALSDPIYPALLPGLFDEGWAKLCASAACKPPAALLELGTKFAAAIPGLLERLSGEPITLLHGDFRADNMMFAADHSPILIDFQLTGVGSAAYDLAYFVTQSFDVDAAEERRLFARWQDGLVAGGVDEADLVGLWDQYRTAALFCLVYPGVASRGMDLDDPRLQDLANTMMKRMTRAANDLDLAALLA